jgi:hypothetical protein
MALPDHVARLVRRNPNLIPLRLEFFDPPQVLFRAVQNMEHAVLCHAFSLDPASCWFDVPESFRAAGSQRSGAGRTDTRREISGFVFRGPKDGRSPIAKIAIARESDKFRDYDPACRQDFERLGTT